MYFANTCNLFNEVFSFELLNCDSFLYCFKQLINYSIVVLFFCLRNSVLSRNLAKVVKSCSSLFADGLLAPLDSIINSAAARTLLPFNSGFALGVVSIKV